ncbi:hypothetical protein OHA79_37105 [Streptomyces sp. NBC_00841]|uniref:hypothetical protein n=1 Tax=unclassified Streptomyces TaxID=2593676 RepID=UPI00225575A4|nr:MULTISPECIES: hypothetical protein [unclassified Streptomyces]MCX4531451.1 hypothetical protein [Streptomyces sp. NBC_01669]WSA02971.1 hypothetical protein OHA79_37105 [Streptomyces sp. NBC_00841]
MDAFLPLLTVVGGLAAVMGFFTWLAFHVRRRGTAGAAITAALASYDEAFRVTAHEAHHEIRAQAERKAPILSPGDHWRRSPDEGSRPGAGNRRPRRARPRRGLWGLGRRVGRPNPRR